MEPTDSPEAVCPACDRPYDSVSEHADGLLVNLLDNTRYRRVCFDPVLVGGEGRTPSGRTQDDDAGNPEARVRFYHHTHEQAATPPPSDGTDVDPVSRE